MLLNEVVFINRECDFITRSVLWDLMKQDPSYRNSVKVYEIKRLRKFIKNLRYLYNKSVILCSPVDLKLHVLLRLLLLHRVRKLVLIIPPNPIHSRYSFLRVLLNHVLRVNLKILSLLGTRILLAFTTPYERIVFETIVHGFDYIYIPACPKGDRVLRELIHVDKPLISFFVYEPVGLNIMFESIRVLEDLGYKPKFFAPLLKEDIGCIDDYRVICMYSDEDDNIINSSTIVVSQTPSAETNNVICKCMYYGKPVITSMDHGMAIYHLDSGLVFIQKKWDGELLAEQILEIINNIDSVKKRSLTLQTTIPKSDYGISLLNKFLQE